MSLGPIRIWRYFMTIREAVQLVLCVGSTASHGHTFVLDMGNPRRSKAGV